MAYIIIKFYIIIGLYNNLILIRLYTCEDSIGIYIRIRKKMKGVSKEEKVKMYLFNSGDTILTLQIDLTFAKLEWCISYKIQKYNTLRQFFPLFFYGCWINSAKFPFTHSCIIIYHNYAFSSITLFGEKFYFSGYSTY